MALSNNDANAVLNKQKEKNLHVALEASVEQEK